MIYKWLKNNLSFSVSRQCLLCLSPANNKHSLCLDCENDLPGNTDHCLICSAPFAITSNQKKLVCGKCQKNPPQYTSSTIPHIYSSPIKQLITQLKFHSNLAHAPLLAHGFVKAIQQRKAKLPECIIPVPLHPKRLRDRGFNQALELARLVSKQLDVPLNYSLCKRNKVTPFQSGLSAKERKQNLKNAFSLEQIHNYKHIAIFDDVVTTGTTVNELAKQLKSSGVEVVEVWAIARTQNKQ